MTVGEYTIASHDACADCGICCQVFFKGKNTNGSANLTPRSKRWVEQEMEPLTPEQAIALDLLAFTPEQIMEYTAEGYELARCILLDPETKRCTDYENRPSGCVDYPTYCTVKQHKHCPLYDLIIAEREAEEPVTSE